MPKSLKLGIMTNQEFADWLGIKVSSLQAGGMKAKKLEELKNYAKFEVVKGKINILEIYVSVYEKKSEKIMKEVEKSMIKKIKDGVPWTCVQMGNYCYLKLSSKYGGEERTYNYRVQVARDNLWGTPGEGRNCHRVTVKMYRGIDAKDNVYMVLSDREEEVKNRVFKKYYSVKPEVLIDYKEGHIDSKQLVDSLGFNDDQKYRNCIKELSKELGCDWVVRATVIDNTTLRLDDR